MKAVLSQGLPRSGKSFYFMCARSSGYTVKWGKVSGGGLPLFPLASAALPFFPVDCLRRPPVRPVWDECETSARSMWEPIGGQCETKWEQMRLRKTKWGLGLPVHIHYTRKLVSNESQKGPGGHTAQEKEQPRTLPGDWSVWNMWEPIAEKLAPTCPQRSRGWLHTRTDSRNC